MNNILSILTISDSLALLIVIESPQTFDLIELLGCNLNWGAETSTYGGEVGMICSFGQIERGYGFDHVRIENQYPSLHGRSTPFASNQGYKPYGLITGVW